MRDGHWTRSDRGAFQGPAPKDARSSRVLVERVGADRRRLTCHSSCWTTFRKDQPQRPGKRREKPQKRGIAMSAQDQNAKRTEEDVNGSSVDTRWSTCATFSKMLAVAIYRFADEFRGYGGTFDLGTRPTVLFLFAICYRQGTWYPC